jgi:hypothetical protein
MAFILKTKPAPNKLDGKMIRLLACMEIKSAVKAMALLWAKLVWLIRAILNDAVLGLKGLDVNLYYERVCDILLRWSKAAQHPELFDPFFNAFAGIPKTRERKDRLDKLLEHFREGNVEELQAVEKVLSHNRIYAHTPALPPR